MNVIDWLHKLGFSISITTATYAATIVEVRDPFGRVPDVFRAYYPIRGSDEAAIVARFVDYLVGEATKKIPPEIL